MNIELLAERQQLIWILADKKSARIAVPYDLPYDDSFPSPPERGWSIEEALALALRFLDKHADWVLVLSVLKEGSNREEIAGVLPQHRSRPADRADFDALLRVGLDVPFGPWARPEAATLWLVTS